MPTEKFEIFGEFEYPQVFEFNRDKEGPNGVWKSAGGATKVTLIMDEENKDKFVSSGSRLKIRERDDGRYMVYLKRLWVHPTIPELGGPPEIVHADNTPWNPDEDGLIGNGSKGYVLISTYDTKTGKGTRLDALQIIEHVPYESDRTYVAGFANRADTAEGKKAATKAKATKKPDVVAEDEIPF